MSDWAADIERIADEIHNAYEEGYADGKRDAVVHGHWIQTQDKDENGNAYYSCSVCGSGECHVPEVNVPYCWKCGSKMDEVTE